MTASDPRNAGKTMPGGLIGAWWNVVVCAIIVVGAPIAVISNGRGSGALAMAAGVVVIAIVMEVLFVRNLLRQLAARRGR